MNISDIKPGAIKLYRVTEDDLRELEAALPRLCEYVGEANNMPQVQVLFTRCKDILSDVRWGYGPPQEVSRIPAAEDGE